MDKQIWNHSQLWKVCVSAGVWRLQQMQLQYSLLTSVAHSSKAWHINKSFVYGPGGSNLI